MGCDELRMHSVIGRTLSLGVSALLALSIIPHAALGDESSDLSRDLAYQDELFVGGLMDDPTPALSIHDANESSLAPLGDLPTAYSSREAGYVTPSENQGSFGTCWAFSMNAGLEGYLLSHGYVTSPEAINLSERHLTYFAYHVVPDPLGNTTLDATNPVGSHYLNRGATLAMGSHVLESWMGCALEDAVPTYASLLDTYRAYGQTSSDFFNAVALADDLSHSANAYHLTGSRRIPLRDTDDIKAAIMEYGAVAAGYKQSAECYNASTYAYYNPSTKNGSGHGVAIIGWDDDFSASNFKSTNRPDANGAWLIKNSWGPTWGDRGCFWISYEDPTLVTSTGKALALEAEPAELEDNIYQYDGSSGECYNTIGSGGSIASIFTTAGNPSEAERLNAVSFSLTDVNVDYSVQVYTSLFEDGNPTSGVAMLDEPVCGSTTYAGFYTVKLPKPVDLREGTTFAVAVTFSHKDGSSVGYDVDCTFGANGRYASSYTWVDYTSHVEEGQSFERDVADGAWDDLSLTAEEQKGAYDEDDEPECCARLKAFTSNITLDEMTYAESSPMWRLYNPNSGEHFYTASTTERDVLVGLGWTNEGVGWTAPAMSQTPVYRLYNPNAGDHHYTVSERERDVLVSVGWTDEGIGWYGDDNRERPLYRQYNPNAVTGAHNYTTNRDEAKKLVELGWSDEGIGWFGTGA